MFSRPGKMRLDGDRQPGARRFALSRALCHNRATHAARPKGLPWRRRRAHAHIAQSSIAHVERIAHVEQNSGPLPTLPTRAEAPPKESQMPKMKTKSGAKKRFKVTGTGRVLYQQSRKRHGMIKRTKKQIRQLRGTAVLFKTDGDNVIKYFLPNG
jgi:large subunit ribosomal protein L35